MLDDEHEAITIAHHEHFLLSWVDKKNILKRHLLIFNFGVFKVKIYFTSSNKTQISEFWSTIQQVVLNVWVTN